MNEYNLKLDVFEGPLELLMHLIEKNKLNIYDIPISEVTEQYMAYIKAWEEFDIDIASEFLVMAATLLLIKSKTLLPRPAKTEVEQEEIDLREELVNRLLEYKKYRMVADQLSEMFYVRNKFLTREPTSLNVKPPKPKCKLADLLMAFTSLWESFEPAPTVIVRENFSVQDKMRDIITLLQKNKRIEFSTTLIRDGSKAEKVTSFLALLELMKMQQIAIYQNDTFGSIFIALIRK